MEATRMTIGSLSEVSRRRADMRIGAVRCGQLGVRRTATCSETSTTPRHAHKAGLRLAGVAWSSRHGGCVRGVRLGCV